MKTTNPNQHLNHEQICDLLLDNATADAAQDANREHLQDCLICASELELLRASVTNFRSASVIIADRAFARRELHPALGSNQPKRPARYLTPAYFWAATAVLLTAALPLGLYHSNLNPFLKHPQPVVVATTAATKASTLESDEALLEGINQELSASVPLPLQPLASTTSNASAQTTSSQQ
jgi:anti-sigma factor RsiW